MSQEFLISEQIMPTTYLREYGRTLIDVIFHEQDQKLVTALQERLDKLDRRQQLACVCGIDDEPLLNHMIDLDLQPEIIAAIAVVPLVAVAWADGSVQTQERDAILKAADSCGVARHDGGYPMLEYWLGNKPGSEILDAWKLYITALCKQLDEKDVAELKHDLLARVHEVAKAAGGILGITSKISSKEQAMLTILERAFDGSQ